MTKNYNTSMNSITTVDPPSADATKVAHCSTVRPKKFKKILILNAVLLLLIANNLLAQVFGGNPSSMQWRQVNNKTARVIYPVGLDSVAQRVANVVACFQPSIAKTIGDRYKPVSIVLQNQSLISNAFVQLGPYRSEFYMTPSQNSFELGSLPWVDQLAIHEFRHVEQYNNFNVGLSKVFRILFGQQGQELANSLVVPNWFWEGDAVFNETQTSLQGRGRLPYFFNAYRSLWQEQKNYSWMKLRNGSFRDFVPDHYALGYMLTAYGREKYGDDFWKNVTHDAASFKGVFYPFQLAVKKYSSTSYEVFRNDAISFMQRQLTNGASISTTEHFLGDQEFPNYLPDGRLLYMSSSYKQIPRFVINNNGVEKKLRVRDISLDNYYSIRNNKLVYTAYRSDVRWGYRDYNEIKLLDINTGAQRTVTHRSKYFSPDINEGGSQIVAVAVFPDQRNELHILSADSGNVLKRIPNKDKLFYTYPKFYKNNEVIAAVRDSKGEMSLMMINTDNNQHKVLIPFSWHIIGFPQITGDTVFFSASAKDKDELFALVLPDAKLYKLQSPLLKGVTGNYQLVSGNGKMAWANFSAVGMRLKETSTTSVTWVSVDDFNAPNRYDFGVNALSNKQTSDLLDKVGDSSYPENKYSKGYKLFNFHSWRPAFEDPDYYYSLFGENVLNTFQSEIYVDYNRNEKYKKIGFNAIYGDLFPYLSAGVAYTFDRNGLGKYHRIYWNELEASAGLSVPLNLSRGRNITRLSIGSFYNYNSSYFQGSYKDSIGTIDYGYLNNTISFSNQIQSARQNIYPRFAQTLTLNYKTAIQKYTANQFLASANLYWPGLFINHSFVINLAFQGHDTLRHPFTFSNGFPFSRGYQAENLYRMYKWGVNYHLPLFYPDWGFASIVYFQRVRANLFFDYTNAQDFYSNRSKFDQNFRSTGTEIFFDTKWWNQLPVSFGIRYSYLLDDDKFGGTGHNRWDFVLPINLISR
ncbi:TolB family protein [Pinibacter soli]|uniref:Uncharacterized protein n=1 Tax=Pinibacter soli TaxID=3044211 RepID=A0ABT6RIF4_9BACT|nr:hypothetical protein [Pinibacter soli]MDI3321644.1 hypothetical protein [Pinibacter soli]